MPLTNTLAAIVISATWLTNHMENERHGNYWLRTNVASLQTVTAVVGDGILAQRHTNTVALATNVTPMMVLRGKVVPITNSPALMEFGRPIDAVQAVVRGLPPVPKK